MIRVSTLIIIAFLISSCERTAEQFKLKSPDGTIAVQLEMKDNSPHYSIRIDGEEVIKSSALGFDINTKVIRPSNHTTAKYFGEQVYLVAGSGRR